jgi:hypothetical protein
MPTFLLWLFVRSKKLTICAERYLDAFYRHNFFQTDGNQKLSFSIDLIFVEQVVHGPISMSGQTGIFC